MRAAAIFGLSSSERDLRPFQRESNATWLVGLPASSGEADAILIFGGDGTVHRHLAQLAKLQLPVLVVPCGGGNDFARALNLRRIRDSIAAWRKFCSGGDNVRAIDLGVITPFAPPELKPSLSSRLSSTAEEAGEKVGISGSGAEALTHLKPLIAGPRPCSTQNQTFSAACEAASIPAAVTAGEVSESPSRYFCCVGGVGLDVEIARRANQLPRWIRRRGGYLLSLLPALVGFKPLPVRIQSGQIQSDQPGPSGGFAIRHDGPAIVVAFANAPAYGDGIKIAPDAQLDDGKLDICVVGKVGKARVLRLFPSVYSGRHLSIPEVKYFQAERLRLETEQPMDVYADGEYVCRTPVEVTVEQAALRVIVPGVT